MHSRDGSVLMGLPPACALLACIALAHACGGDGDSTGPPPDPPRPASVTVSPATSELTAVGATVQLRAEVRDQSGNVLGGAAMTWSSDDTAVATVNASGLVTAAANGTATIAATAGTTSGSATVTVAQQVSAVELTPAGGIVLPGTTLQLSAEARDANGHSVAGAAFTWASSDPAVAVVDATGLVSGIALGEVEVSATSSGVIGRAQLEVAEPAPTAVAVSRDAVAFDALGDTVRLAAEVRDQAGRPMPDEVVRWAAGDTLVATVTVTGLVTAVGNGGTTITATSGTLSSAATVDVTQVARRLAVSPPADTLILGDSVRLTAEAFDANGHPVPSVAFAWSTSDASLAVVDTSGAVRGVAEGTAEITAATGNVRGSARITMFSPDRAPLVALYDATDGPNWVRSDNWLTDKPLAQWHGVTTDTSGRVIWLALHGERDSEGIRVRHGLKGAIPPDIGRLDQLTHLSLWGNELSGTIPPRLGDLGSLELLDLLDNELSGPIPPELGSLGSLVALVAGKNSFEGALPPELGNLARLENLSVGGNELTGPIPSEFGHLARLEFLDLGENRLSGLIPSELASLANLKLLQLHSNELTGPIPSEFGHLARLEFLDLTQNRLSGPIPSELGSLASLKSLLLYSNELTGPIPSQLGRLTNLTHLWLNSNGLTGPIPSELGYLTELRELVLSRNELSGPIPPELGNLTRLDRLVLSWNRLTGPIPSTLGSLEELTVLALQNNALTGSIPGELGATSLERLDLWANDLTGPIPAELGDLTGLRALRVDGNALTGPLPGRLGELSALTHLHLQENRLEGAVPPEFGALTALREFNLTNNTGMTGLLPAGLTALARLDLFLAGGTKLCAPSETDFETWLGGIWRHRIDRCPEASASTAYLTQAVQSREFPVPLVAGEEALLRVFVTARESSGEAIPRVRARFFADGRETHVQDIPGKRSAIPTTVDESGLHRSANAEIPGSVLQPGLEMVIEVDPEGTLDPGLGVARRIPETGRMKVDVQVMPLLDLTIIPFVSAADPDLSIVDLVGAMAADPANHPLLRETRTLLPVGDLAVSAHEPVLTSTFRSHTILNQTSAIRALEGGSGHYMGMVDREVVDRVGGLGIPSGRVTFSQNNGVIMAHELGHNMSLRHAPCGGTNFLDPAFPRADGSIGAWGYDFAERALVDPSYADIMGFCPPREWIGDYHFAQALRFRLRDEGGSVGPDREGQARALLLWGGVDADGAPFLEPAFVVDAPPLLPDAAGDHRLTGLTVDGAELFSLSFAMPDVADGDGSSGFAFAMPVQSSWAGALAGIALSGPGGSVLLDGDSDRAVAIVRNPRSGQVRGFLRGAPANDAFEGAALAASGAEEALEVLFSRGIPDAAAWVRPLPP